MLYNLEETKKLAIEFSRILKPGDIVALVGDLGAGKTFISQNIIMALGVDDYITSPTFTIVNEYEGKYKINHFDVYRIDDIDELYEIGFEDYVYKDAISLIEWADKIYDILENYYIIDIRVSGDIREITIDGSNEMIKKKVEDFYESIRN